MLLLLRTGTALVGVPIVIFDAVSGATAGWVAGACTALAMTAFWIGLPLFQRFADEGGGGQRRPGVCEPSRKGIRRSC